MAGMMAQEMSLRREDYHSSKQNKIRKHLCNQHKKTNNIKIHCVQIMAWRLVGAKPLSEPMLEYSQFEPQEQTSVKS